MPCCQTEMHGTNVHADVRSDYYQWRRYTTGRIVTSQTQLRKACAAKHVSQAMRCLLGLTLHHPFPNVQHGAHVARIAKLQARGIPTVSLTQVLQLHCSC